MDMIYEVPILYVSVNNTLTLEYNTDYQILSAVSVTSEQIILPDQLCCVISDLKNCMLILNIKLIN